jgi:hypothetical protein
MRGSLAGWRRKGSEGGGVMQRDGSRRGKAASSVGIGEADPPSARSRAQAASLRSWLVLGRSAMAETETAEPSMTIRVVTSFCSLIRYPTEQQEPFS